MAGSERGMDGLMPVITCSTGAITRCPDATDPERPERWCSMIHADSFEVMFYDSWYGQSGAIAQGSRALGVQWFAVHAEKNIGPNLLVETPSTLESSLSGLAENRKFARQVGPAWCCCISGSSPDGDAKLGQQLDVLPPLTDIVQAEGVHLGIEAIPCTVNTPLENQERVIARIHMSALCSTPSSWPCMASSIWHWMPLGPGRRAGWRTSISRLQWCAGGPEGAAPVSPSGRGHYPL